MHVNITLQLSTLQLSMRAVRVTQNIKVAAEQLNNELKLTIKILKAEGLPTQVIIICRFITTSSSFVIVFDLSFDEVIVKILNIAALKHVDMVT